MAQTLSKGYIKPETGDRGSVVFPALEANVDLNNSHKHDGSDGEKIDGFSIQKTVQTLLSSGWSADLGGSTYSRTVTVPTNINLSNDRPQFLDQSGNYVYPTVTKLSNTSMTVVVNDNSLTLTVIYG